MPRHHFSSVAAKNPTSHSLPLSFLATSIFATVAVAATASIFPYESTTLLTLSDTVYAFQGPSFASYNATTSDRLTTSPNWTTITDQLPFVGDANTATYSVTIANETLVAYAGDCKRGDGSIWVYDSPGRQWNRKPVVNGSDDVPFMLGGAVGFTSTVDPDSEVEPSIYAFGGMCGTPSSSIWAWQSASDFTNHMIRLSADSRSATTNYNASVLTTQNTPIAAAGFTWTATAPALANKAQTVAQQVDHVMIGGHTAWAFVNTSSVALWQLPEETWSFVPVSNYRSISSRSGHTTVLSEDGSSLVLMGGWVGQVTNPAKPQLVVLKMSDSDKNWKWEIPANQPSGNGIFGHGATVLPGNVLMVYGGYEISSSESTKRAISGSSMFYNMTSGEWNDSYTNPEVPVVVSTTATASSTATATAEATSASSGDSNKNRNIGLGLGLGLGVPALLPFILLCGCLYRRHRSKKSRDDAIRALAQDESHFLHPAEGTMMERESGGPWFSRPAEPWASVHRTPAYESLKEDRNESSEGPIQGRSSMQISRSGDPNSSRGAYMAAVPNDPIEPIAENNEDDTVIIHRNEDMGHMANVHQPPPVDDYQQQTQPPSRDDTRRLTDTDLRQPGSPLDAHSSNWIRNVDDLDDELLARMNRGKKGSAEIRNALAAVEGRPVSKASTNNSNPSYSTAKSTFVALRNEGPGLLMGGDRPTTPPLANFKTRQVMYNEVPEDESQYYEETPGSPSKYRARDSWLGSLRRVFSGKTDSSYSVSGAQSQQYSSSATRGDLTDGFMTGTDYDPHMAGDGTSEGAASALLRRKQGRQAWEDMPPHLRGSEGDWDVERAVEQRLVQVMFTVPQERSRVATAEYEREAQAVVVDPDESEDASLVSNAGDISVQVDYSHVDSEIGDQGVSRSFQRGARRSISGERLGEPAATKAGLRGGASDLSLSTKRSLSPLTARGRSPYLEVSDMSSVRYSTELHTAEMVTLEKPKSRVRQMVNSIESRHSRESSPAAP
ncbi:hypothetical protein BROUX41_004924 [Berkeleyomyces rouxiae]